MNIKTYEKAGHTPTPWELSEDGCSITGANGGTLICETSKAAWENLAAAAAQGNTLAADHLPEVMANARLIAAAPALLEALKGAIHYAEAGRATMNTATNRGQIVAFNHIIDACNAAIQLAEGGK